VYNIRCRYDQIEHASEEALRHAALAGQRRTHLFLLPMALTLGPRPVDEALARLANLTSVNVDDGGSDGAILLAMRGDLDEARALLDVDVAHLDELGLAVGHAYVADYERLVGNDEKAAEELAVYCAYLAEHGHTSLLSTYAPLRGRHLCALGRFDEAERLAEQGRELGHADDPITQSLWRRVLALVLAHRGDPVEAQRLVREALVIAQTTDSPWYQGEALTDLAHVLEAAGRLGEATAAHREALDLYERKGIRPLAHRTRERLAALQGSAG
jgi:tetratricopeptide (TPR) repeat protein